MKRSIVILLAIFTAVNALWPKEAQACVDQLSWEDYLIWGTWNNNCGPTVNWVRAHYDTWDSSWDPAGAGDVCNIVLPHAKVTNAAAFIAWGLFDDFNYSWHATGDYQPVAMSDGSASHDRLWYKFVNAYDAVALSHPPCFLFCSEYTDLECPLFESGTFGGGPETRAGTLVHEGWHHWGYKYGQDDATTHKNWGCAEWWNNACDYWYWHRVYDVDFGQLYHVTHSPHQIQAEFLSDAAIRPVWWVRQENRQRARDNANYILGARIIGGRPWWVDDPRPL